MGQPAAEKACGICDRFGRCGRGLRSPGRDTMRSVRRLRLSLASQILVFQLAIVLGALMLGAAASYLNESRQLDQRYEQRSLNIARSVAGMHPWETGFATRIRHEPYSPSLRGSAKLRALASSSSPARTGSATHTPTHR